MIGVALEQAVSALGGVTATPRLDAEVLLAHVLGIDRGQLRARAERPLSGVESARFVALVKRRGCGEPVAYLVGRRDFWSLPLEVNAAVLVPRPESELLVELGLERLPRSGAVAVLDLGTGSGAIGLAIARERPDARVDLVDSSPAAVAVAERNRVALGLHNARTLCGDWYAPTASSRYALIVANPPYLAAADPHLAGPELRHEPRSALVAGPSGLEAIGQIVGGARQHLTGRGSLIVEHGATQGLAARQLFAAAGLDSIDTRRDLAGLDRATLGREPG
jgi:release factor glutamine methyltransferase